MTWPARIAIIVPLLGAYGMDFFSFLFPAVLVWLFFAGILFLLPLIIFSGASLFERRWKLVAVYVLAWLLLCLPYIGFTAPSRWLNAAGFYVKTRLTDDHVSRCRLTDFAENGVKQTAGFCRGFDRGDYFEYVVYDTTGEFVLPVSQRTPEWKQVMSVATVRAVVSEEHRAQHLFGNFYFVVVSTLELEG